jgi:CRP/FNR family transcriptional regulator, cyclic AMP receptor protein
MAALEGALEGNPVFSRLGPGLRQRLVAGSTRRRYAQGERILSEGEPADRIFALEQGRVRVFHASPDGLEVLLKIFHAPAIFGEAEALSGAPYVENVDAVEPCEILVLPPSLLLDVLRADAAAAVEMLVDVASRLAIAAQNQKSLAFDPITVRLANYLVDLATFASSTNLELRITQDDMAAAVGATRRSIAKDVATWQHKGILVRRGDRYVIEDLEALRGFADDNHRGLSYSIAPRKR